MKEAENATDAAIAKASDLRKQYLASVEQRSNEVANVKLQNLEPRSYRLAQQIEQASHRTKLADGSFVWVVKIREDRSFLSIQMDEEQDHTRTAVLYVNDREGRLDLFATAPAALPNERNQPKGKQRQ